jgi:hypothetical protein
VWLDKEAQRLYAESNPRWAFKMAAFAYVCAYSTLLQQYHVVLVYVGDKG